MEVSMSKTRRGKYTDNRICYISKCKGDMRRYLRRKGKLPCFSYLVRGKSFSFYRGKIQTFLLKRKEIGNYFLLKRKFICFLSNPCGFSYMHNRREYLRGKANGIGLAF